MHKPIPPSSVGTTQGVKAGAHRGDPTHNDLNYRAYSVHATLYPPLHFPPFALLRNHHRELFNNCGFPSRNQQFLCQKSRFSESLRRHTSDQLFVFLFCLNTKHVTPCNESQCKQRTTGSPPPHTGTKTKFQVKPQFFLNLAEQTKATVDGFPRHSERAHAVYALLHVCIHLSLPCLWDSCPDILSVCPDRCLGPSGEPKWPMKGVSGMLPTR